MGGICMSRNGQSGGAAGPDSDGGFTVRYDVIVDPAQRFVVWDRHLGCPAVMDAELLVCGSLPEARRVAEELNDRR